jgi:hypothetical protein
MFVDTRQLSRGLTKTKLSQLTGPEIKGELSTGFQGKDRPAVSAAHDKNGSEYAKMIYGTRMRNVMTALPHSELLRPASLAS